MQTDRAPSPSTSTTSVEPAGIAEIRLEFRHIEKAWNDPLLLTLRLKQLLETQAAASPRQEASDGV